ncbi:GTP cyclohydrolase I [Pseudomonas putida S11]|nr:GTP cyclohydrolase I [Pseudomonas putida S11]
MSLEQNYTEILSQIGEDVSREGLLDTPKRAAKAMKYLCRGYEQTLEEVTNNALFSSDNSEMVLVRDIELYSMCEHHMLPFIGKAHVAYLPKGKVLGLSKVARIVDMYARRLQIQENPQPPGCRGRAAGNRRRRCCRGHRSQAHVHDDARCREAELDHDHLGDAG